MQILHSKRKVHTLYLVLALMSLLLGGIAQVRAQEPLAETPETVSLPSPTPNTTAAPELTAQQKDRFINLVRNVSGKMDAAIIRLIDISSRLEKRIEILKSQGIDTSRASVALNESRVKLTDAQARLVRAKAEAETALDGDAPFRNFPPIRREFRSIRDEIRGAYILIRESLVELKDATLARELNRRNVGLVPEATVNN